MLMLKPGVRITGIRPEMVLAVCAAERVYEEMGADSVVTACVDGKHSTGSFHYAGAAVDLLLTGCCFGQYREEFQR